MIVNLCLCRPSCRSFSRDGLGNAKTSYHVCSASECFFRLLLLISHHYLRPKFNILVCWSQSSGLLRKHRRFCRSEKTKLPDWLVCKQFKYLRHVSSFTISNHFRGICRTYPNLIKENQRMSTCN